ncbi:MAG: serine hydrolase domain-containing protein [Bacteroidales bacterium]|nr:serine hydrolase domain-containing protein [Bacteroidales bacterium]
MISLSRIATRGLSVTRGISAARRISAVSVFILAVTGCPVAAQELSPGLKHDIDSLYRAFAEENHLPGIAYGIVIDTSLAYAGVTGYSNLTDGTPVTPSTAFRAASMTKSFTAMAVMKLRDEGKLDLDDPVYRYLPELKNLQYLSADAPVLTIRHLLTHTGGFPQDDPWADRQLETTEDELSAMIGEGLSMSNVPGVTYEYSNLGYTLLGAVIRAVTGESYQSYISSAIFMPLGMKSTVWEYDDLPAGLMAQGYRYRSGEWSEEPLLHDGPFGSMGGLISTVSDFARYVIMHLSAWPPRDDKESGPMKRGTLREMHSPSSGVAYSSSTLYPGGPDCHVVMAYGYGLRWSVDCTGSKKVYHNGGLPGFGSNWTIMPDYGIGVVAFSNRTYGSTWAVNQMVLELVADAMDIRPRTPAVTGILRSRMNDLVRILPRWDVSGCDALFADNFFADNPLEELRAQSARIFGAAGDILNVREIVPVNSLRGSFVMEGREGNIAVGFTLTPESTPKIQAVSIALTPKR